MNLVDLLSTIIAVTVVVALALGLVIYLAPRLGPARKPAAEATPRDGSWYFVRYDPDGGARQTRADPAPPRSGQDLPGPNGGSRPLTG